MMPFLHNLHLHLIRRPHIIHDTFYWLGVIFFSVICAWALLAFVLWVNTLITNAAQLSASNQFLLSENKSSYMVRRLEEKEQKEREEAERNAYVKKWQSANPDIAGIMNVTWNKRK